MAGGDKFAPPLSIDATYLYNIISIWETTSLESNSNYKIKIHQ